MKPIKVRKKSGKPFKSGLKIQTAIAKIPHDFRADAEAYIFEECDSQVSTDLCERVEDE